MESGTPRQRLGFLLWKLADLIQADQRRRSFRAKAYRSPDRAQSPSKTRPLDRVVEVAVEHGVAVESNGHRDRLDLSSELARLAMEHGAFFVANSDAHRFGEFDNVGSAVATLQRAGIESYSVVNTLPPRRILQLALAVIKPWPLG